MQQASSMVWSLGMGSNGFIGDYTVLLGTAKGQSESLISDQMKDRLNLEVQSILHKAAEETEALLIRERPLLDAFAQALLEHSELDYDEIEAIFKAQGRERVSTIKL
jgi:ATP-dependent Zn protease